MNLSNPKNVVTEERLSEFYTQILPYLGGMPDILANKFNKSDLYSTDEKMIGQWTDGKPLYQKTFDCGTLPNNSVKNFAHNISNLENIVDMKGIGISNGQVIPIQWSVDYDSTYGITLYCNAINIVFVTKRDQTSYHAYVTLQYTKITDSAISIGSDTDYSTTEKIVGTWIDGKPIYQKTWTGLNATIPRFAWSDTVIDTSGLNIKYLIDYRILRVGGNGLMIYIPEELSVENNSLGIYGNNTERTISTVTLRYTKSTD